MVHCFWFPEWPDCPLVRVRNPQRSPTLMSRGRVWYQGRALEHDREQRAPHGPLAPTDLHNSRSGGGDYAALERKVADLQREVRGRSRSPLRRGGNRKPKALPAPPQTLALTDGPNAKKRTAGRKNSIAAPKAKAKASTKSGPSKGVQQLMTAGDEIRKKFYATDNSICFRFQRHICDKGSKCELRHICIGCGGNKPYDDCLCLNSQFN